MNNRKALIYTHISAVLFGASGLIGKWVLLPATVISLGRGLFSTIFLFTLMKLSKEDWHLHSRKDYGLTILAGILLSVNWVTFLYSIQLSTVAIGTLTGATCPLFLTFLEPLLFREKIKGSSLVTAAGILIGVLFTIPEFSLENSITRGIFWGMIASLSYALFSLINRNLTSRYSAAKISMTEQSIVTLCLIPTLFLSEFTVTATELGLIAMTGILLTALPYVLFIAGQKQVSAQTGGVICGLETVYSIIFAMVLLSEFPTTKTLLGGIVILGAATLSTLISSRESFGRDKLTGNSNETCQSKAC